MTTIRKPLPSLPIGKQDLFLVITLDNGDDFVIDNLDDLKDWINVCIDGQGPFCYIKSITDKFDDTDTPSGDKCPDCHITYSSNGKCSCHL